MRSAAAATALGLTLSLAGLASCASPDGLVPTGPPEPAATPVFASDEEALAAAEEVYGRYYEFANRLAASGWTETEGAELVLGGTALKEELASAEDFASKGYRQIGEATFDTMSLQQVRDQGSTRVVIVVYVCSDVTNVEVIDKAGDSVVSATRPDRQSIEVEMNDADGELKVVRREAWSGATFC